MRSESRIWLAGVGPMQKKTFFIAWEILVTCKATGLEKMAYLLDAWSFFASVLCASVVLLGLTILCWESYHPLFIIALISYIFITFFYPSKLLLITGMFDRFFWPFFLCILKVYVTVSLSNFYLFSFSHPCHPSRCRFRKQLPPRCRYQHRQ